MVRLSWSICQPAGVCTAALVCTRLRPSISGCTICAAPGAVMTWLDEKRAATGILPRFTTRIDLAGNVSGELSKYARLHDFPECESAFVTGVTTTNAPNIPAGGLTEATFKRRGLRSLFVA